jgi:AcrR family transcriptional regulator
VTPPAKTPEASDASARRPGRPRSAEAHQAILGATLQLLVENGFAGLSMEGVAARSGTSKATVYRRWASKVELVVEALNLLSAMPAGTPDTGTARGDFLELTQQVFAVADPRLPILMPRLMAEAVDHPELYTAVMDNMVKPRRAILAEILSRGVQRGELRADLDVELAIDLVLGPLIYRVILAGADLSPVREMRERVWDAVIEGIGPTSTSGGRRSPRASRR